MTAGLIDLARIENQVPHTVPRQKICFDEWNVWDPVRAPGELGAEEKYQAPASTFKIGSDAKISHRYTLSDALAVSVWLNVFVRQSRHIGMANIAQSVNVISPLMTHETGLTKQSTWWPLWLFSRYMRGSTLAVHLRCGEYDGPTKPAWIRGTVDTPWLDVSGAIDDERVVSLAVVNIHASEDFEVKIDGIPAGTAVTVYTVSGKAVECTNTKEGSDVQVEECRWDAEDLYTFPKHSLTMLRYHTSL